MEQGVDAYQATFVEQSSSVDAENNNSWGGTGYE